MAYNLTSQKHRQIFNQLDIDRSGLITIFEWTKYFNKFDPYHQLDERKIKLLFYAIDKDESGKISFNEFSRYLNARNRVDISTQKGFYTMIFKLLDTDCSGTLETNELKKYFLAYGCVPNQQSLDNFMKLLDSNHDGHVSLEEFTKHC